MSQQDSAQERTEQATPKRLNEARRKGQVARSKELTTALVMLAGAALLLVGGPSIAGRLAASMTHILSLPRETSARRCDTTPGIRGRCRQRRAVDPVAARHRRGYRYRRIGRSRWLVVQSQLARIQIRAYRPLERLGTSVLGTWPRRARQGTG